MRPLERLRRSLRARILLPTALLFALTLLTLGVAATSLHRIQLRQSQYERAESVAEMLASGWEAMMLHSGPAEAQDFLGLMVGHRPDIQSISVIRPGGDVRFSSSWNLLQTRPWDRVEQFDELTIVDSVGAEQYAVVRPIRNRPECARCHGGESKTNGWLDVRFSTKPFAEAERALTQTLALAGIPGLLLLIAIAWWLIDREALRPLERVMLAMRKAEEGHMEKADEGRVDEIGEVARGFDSAMAALRQAQTEVEALYREHMIRADRFSAIGELALFLAHEIRNPLTGLSSALELMSQDLAQTPSAAIVDEMQRQVKNLHQTMESVLSYARPPKVRLRSVDVAGCVEDVLRLLSRRRSGRNDPVLRMELAPRVFAIADASLLEQVLLNLCLNAVQAMPNGGTLTVRSSVSGERVLIEVQDSGPGIPLELREAVFRPFFTTKHDGSGLGLAISSRIIAEHGGGLDLRCPETGGSVFTVTLQAAEEAHS
ncbi:MAG: HAMP domain-containing protein [Deltaproteobacteria bacterium]|nr:HAMP domain-containing protein [Deltaproteobacteria bacterium]